MTGLFLGHPVWMWLAFVAVVLLLLAFDLGVLHKGDAEIGVRESLVLSSIYIALGLLFGVFVWWQVGQTAAIEYVTGFIIEKSLAIDNVFVIAMIFGFFAIPLKYQHRVLFWGILGVVVLRAIMIALGATLVQSYAWTLYLFAVFLVATGIKMLIWSDHAMDLSNNPILRVIRKIMPVTEQLHGNRFFVRLPSGMSGKAVLHATPLFVALALIEFADLLFAVDSVPAIFAITTDPFIVYTSNVFAILGLRALYFALAAILHRFAYLKQALAVLLIFIGGKIFIADMMGWTKFPAWLSLGITFAILAAGVLYSLARTRHAPLGHPPHS